MVLPISVFSKVESSTQNTWITDGQINQEKLKFKENHGLKINLKKQIKNYFFQKDFFNYRNNMIVNNLSLALFEIEK